MAENSGTPVYVTALGETNEENLWRENKAQGDA
ncbi:MAG UNVERIFIED_CONTAM: TIGR03032 family protein [Microcystis novacekii LVE1205-3]